MAETGSAHRATSASSEAEGQSRAARARHTSEAPQRAQQGTPAASAAPAALDSLSRLQRLADASPRVAQMRRLQALADAAAGLPSPSDAVEAAPPNRTGLPDGLKVGVESLSGLSMDHVRVHYNSAQPAQLNALAYAQGGDIHLAPGQAQHLPLEAWHVVQQAQGRVRPTLQLKDGVPVNDDAGLEREADLMGERALGILNHPGNEHRSTEDRQLAAEKMHLIMQQKNKLISKAADIDATTTEELESCQIHARYDRQRHGKQHQTAVGVQAKHIPLDSQSAIAMTIRLNAGNDSASGAGEALSAIFGQRLASIAQPESMQVMVQAPSRTAQRLISENKHTDQTILEQRQKLRAVSDEVAQLQDGREDEAPMQSQLVAAHRQTEDDEQQQRCFEAKNDFHLPNVRCSPLENPANLNLTDITQMHTQGDDVLQLVAWKVIKPNADSSQEWVQLPPSPQSSGTSPSLQNKPKEDPNNQPIGCVYDDATNSWYTTEEEYRRYIIDSSHQKQVFNFSNQDSKDINTLLSESAAMGAFQITTMVDAEEKLKSFLKNGVLLPKNIESSFTHSADEELQPNQIHVNKLGPFQDQNAATIAATYAATHKANGAIPVALENSADLMDLNDNPDLGVLANRAHNSALAIIDPIEVAKGLHPADRPNFNIQLNQVQGEMILCCNIPSSSFVAVLMPCQMHSLVSQEEIDNYKIKFVGSIEQNVHYNYKLRNNGKGSKSVRTIAPDYKSALETIFKANLGKSFFTHVIRLSNNEPMTKSQDLGTPLRSLQERGNAATSHIAAGDSPTFLNNTTKESSPPLIDSASHADTSQIITIASRIAAKYDHNAFTFMDKHIDAKSLIEMHQEEGVTLDNCQEVRECVVSLCLA